MTSTVKSILLVLTVLAGFSNSAAQGTPDTTRSSFSIQAGPSMPLGHWTASRMNSSIDVFGTGVYISAELDLAISNRWTIAVTGGYTLYDGGAWEDYVAGQGDAITASMYSFEIAVLARPSLLLSHWDMLRFEFGPAGLFARGSEHYEGRNYNYDYLKTFAIGVQGGIEYTRMLNDYIGISVHTAIVAFPSGIQFIDGETRDIISLPITLGLRFNF